MPIYWSSRSPFVRKVMIAAHELGAAADLRPVPQVVTPTSKSAELRAANPLGQLPTLVLDDGSSVFGSHNICEWLDQRYASGRLLPLSPLDRIAVMQREAIADGMNEKALTWLDERFRPEAMRSADKIDAVRLEIGLVLDHLEGEAETWPRDRFDLGDIATVAALAYLDFRFAEVAWREAQPALVRWFDAHAVRPSVSATAYTS